MAPTAARAARAPPPPLRVCRRAPRRLPVHAVAALAQLAERHAARPPAAAALLPPRNPAAADPSEHSEIDLDQKQEIEAALKAEPADFGAAKTANRHSTSAKTVKSHLCLNWNSQKKIPPLPK